MINFKKQNLNQLEFPFIDKNSSEFKWTRLTKPCLLLSELAYGCDDNKYFDLKAIRSDITSIYSMFSGNPILSVLGVGSIIGGIAVCAKGCALVYEN